jgi:L-histidine N-alpha-methyltransferase
MDAEDVDRSGTVKVDNHLPQGWAADTMREDVARALTSQPRILAPRWLYDDRGSALFDEITRLDAYYPTEAERSILNAHADEIVTVTGADIVIELGSGTGDKTRTLLDAFWAGGRIRRFVPLDVSEATLVDAAAALASRYPGLEVHALVGDFTRHLQFLPDDGRRLVVFLGGTIGNLYVEERRAFLGALADRLHPGDSLLLGVDLVKPVQRIVDAYDDPEGITGAFVANVLHVLNRTVGADFDVGAFDYVPLWDAREERMDLRLRPSEPQQVRIAELDLDVALAAGEELHVEISAKFRPERIIGELGELGFDTRERWTDDHGDFGLLLAVRR